MPGFPADVYICEAPAVIDVGKGGEKRALGEKGPVEFLTSNDLEQCGHIVNTGN